MPRPASNIFSSAARPNSRSTRFYVTEAKLRYMMGLAATDGRLIRPKDEPTTAKVTFDWCDVLNEGLVRCVELRQQKWIVKRAELELIGAKNFLLPKLDFVGQYRWLGLGNRLDGPNSFDVNSTATPPPDSNAYRTLTSGEFQEWQLGFQFNMPLGFRREMAGVRNAQLTVTRERAKLQEGELELSHQLAYAVRDLETNYVLSQTDFNRRIAAQRQVEAVANAYETGTITLDVLLSAQQQLAQAESDYYRALVNYNKSIAQVHFRKGSLLEYNGVYLAEGPWPAKAYFDARRRARARDASTYLDYGFTQPKVISRGPIEQEADRGAAFGGSPSQAAPAPVAAPAPQKQQELVPTPEPQPINSGEVPAEPALRPATEPQAANGTRSVPDTNGAECPAADWTAAAARPAASAGWTPAAKGGDDESGSNPPPAADCARKLCQGHVLDPPQIELAGAEYGNRLDAAKAVGRRRPQRRQSAGCQTLADLLRRLR